MDPDDWGFEDTIHYYKEIAPVFNRNGQYYDRLTKFWWFEHSGRAWTDMENKSNKSAYQFCWTMSAFNATILSFQEKDDLRRIINTTTSRKLRRQLQQMIHDSSNAELVYFGGNIDSRKSMLRARKRFEEFRNERKLKNG